MDDQGFFPILVFALFAIIAIAGAIVSWQLEQKRRAALAAVAARLGLSFSAGRNYALASRYEEFRGLGNGSNRYAFNIFSGTLGERRITAFDHHHETSSSDSKGRRRTSHHYHHVVALQLERGFPTLLIAPEGIFSKVAQAFGYDDIDFESHEFSRLYCVRSQDRKYAYDFCNPSMIELLLSNSGVQVETRGATLALVFDGKMSVVDIERKMDLACAIRERIPDYLFATT